MNKVIQSLMKYTVKGFETSINVESNKSWAGRCSVLNTALGRVVSRFTARYNNLIKLGWQQWLQSIPCITAVTPPPDIELWLLWERSPHPSQLTSLSFPRFSLGCLFFSFPFRIALVDGSNFFLLRGYWVGSFIHIQPSPPPRRLQSCMLQ